MNKSPLFPRKKISVALAIDILITSALLITGILGQNGDLSNSLSMSMLYAAAGYAILGLALCLLPHFYVRYKLRPYVVNKLQQSNKPNNNTFEKKLFKTMPFITAALCSLTALGFFIAGLVGYYNDLNYQSLTYTSIAIGNFGIIAYYGISALEKCCKKKIVPQRRKSEISEQKPPEKKKSEISESEMSGLPRYLDPLVREI